MGSNPGMGYTSWWGFTPALNLLEYVNLPSNNTDLNILVVGRGDARDILLTIASHSSSLLKDNRVNFYILENNLEVYARDILLLSTALSSPQMLGLQEKTEFFLEVFGNICIRNSSATQIKDKAGEFIRVVTDLDYGQRKMSNINFSLLKYKERDALEGIFKFWQSVEVQKTFDAPKCWDLRLRQQLGTRYDAIDGIIDWDYHMKLSDRGAGIINRHEYKSFRKTGIAFDLREDAYTVSNPTLASLLSTNKFGDRTFHRGYWGDIVVGPYISIGIESDNSELFKRKNEVYAHTSTEVFRHNINSICEKILAHFKAPTEKENQDSGDSPGKYIVLPKCKIHFLPLNSLSDLHKKAKYQSLFDLIVVSSNTVNLLSKDTKLTCRPDAKLLVESVRFVLDLNNDQVKEMGQKIVTLVESFGWKLKEEFDSMTDNYASFKCTVP